MPNSYIDAIHPQAVLGERYFRGSGTSQSAAIVSGAAALILQKYPGATPDQVKRLLTSTAYHIYAKPSFIGGGELRDVGPGSGPAELDADRGRRRREPAPWSWPAGPIT